jgi:hypothetical protein
LFSDDSSLSDFNFFDVAAVESIGDSLGKVGFIFSIGVQDFSSSNFELGVFCILFNEDD